MVKVKAMWSEGSANLQRRNRNISGVTLISLMIGLVLSSIVTLSALTLYKTVLVNSTNSKILARQDTEAVLVLSSVPGIISKAGYGIRDQVTGEANGKANTDLLLVKDARLASTSNGNYSVSGQMVAVTSINPLQATPSVIPTGNALFWSWLPSQSTVNKCAGLISTSDGVFLLNSQDCMNATSWNQLSWSTKAIAQNNQSSGQRSISSDINFLVYGSTNPCLAARSGFNSTGNNVFVEMEGSNTASYLQGTGRVTRDKQLSSLVCASNIKLDI